MTKTAGPAAPATDATDAAQAGGIADDALETPLRRTISRPLLTLFVLGDVLGAGVYALLGEISGQVGSALWIPLLGALALALLTAASYAELVTRFPRAGGSAVYARRAYRSDVVAFVVGACMLLAGITSVAGLALAFGGEYLATFVDVPPAAAAVALLVVLAVLNARGIRESLRANVVMTVVEVGGLVLVVVLACVLLGRGGADPARLTDLPEGTGALSAVLGATVLAFYSYVGFETSANVAEEVAHPRRDYPRGLLGGVVAAGVVYLALAVTVGLALPAEALAGSTAPLLEVVARADVGIPDAAFAVVALIAIANGALLTSVMSSRLAYGMAVQGLLPRPLGRVLPGRRTPGVAIAVTASASALLALTGDLATLAETVVLLLLVVFLSTNVAVLVLRRRPQEGRSDHVRVPTAIPVLGALSCVLLATQQDGAVWLRAAVLLAVVVLVHLVTRRIGRRRRRAA